MVWPSAMRRVKSMSTKFNDAQLITLSKAARREDRCLVIAEKLKGVAARKFADKLLALGFAKEVKAKAEMPVWRRDEETGNNFSLKLMAAGLKAIAVEAKEDEGTEHEEAVAATAATEGVAMAIIATYGVTEESSTKPTATLKVSNDKIPTDEKPGNGPNLKTNSDVTQNPSAPREGTKLAAVIGLLTRDCGATLSELVAATDWLPHTTRAALTGLRKRGYPVTFDRSDKARGSVYGIAMGHAA